MAADPQAVVQAAGDVVVLADLVPLARIRIEAHLLLGEVSLAIGERRQAMLAFEQALRDSARGPYRLRCADALDGLATAAELGEGAAASSAARALATSIRARCGAVRWLHTTSDSHLRPAPTRATHPANWLHDGTPTAAGIDELMSTIRLPPSGTPIDSLTRAERQIAELVATGLTNTDIATRLFISRRTVETHLTHIYRKLDIRTRTQLAALQLRGGQ